MRGRYNILIIDDVHLVLLEILQHNTITYVPNCSLAELPALLATTEILILRSKLNFGQEWIDKAPKLKCIGRLGSGMDNIDEEYAKTRGVVCFNAPEGNRNAVAEQTIGMLLSLLANVYKGANEVKNGIWDRKGNQGVELDELTLGIIGYGNVGSELAKRLAGFNCKILAYDKYKTGFGDNRVKECTLPQIQNEADIISLHIPLNSTSKEMVDDEFIAKMRKPFYLLNLARGGVICTKAVIEGLKNGKVLGCGLDVLENEKLETLTKEQQDRFNFLSQSPKVILTPHIGGLTKNSYYKLGIVLGEKITKWIKKEPLVN